MLRGWLADPGLHRSLHPVAVKFSPTRSPRLPTAAMGRGVVRFLEKEICENQQGRIEFASVYRDRPFRSMDRKLLMAATGPSHPSHFDMEVCHG